MWGLLLLLAASWAVTDAALNCTVNVTQGVPWAAANVTYNWLSLDVQPTGNFTPQLPWGFDVNTTAGEPQRTYGYNAQTQRVTDFWQPLGSDLDTNFTVVVAGVGVPNITDVRIASTSCTVAPAVTVQPSGTVQSGVQPVGIDGIDLVGVDGKPLTLRGINWFGLEEKGNTMLDGLWITPDSMTMDFATIVYRLQLLGFNSVRLPFSFKNIYSTEPPQSYSQSCNSLTQASIVAATTDPTANKDPGSAPSLKSAAPQTPGICSDDLPDSSVLDRFLYILKFFAQNEIYVVIDNHLNLDSTAVDDPVRWAQLWGQLATSITADPDTAAYVLIEILNEPDSVKLRWEPYNGLPGVKDLYLSGMQAVHAANPNFLLLLEGLGQVGVAVCWVRNALCTLLYKFLRTTN